MIRPLQSLRSFRARSDSSSAPRRSTWLTPAVAAWLLAAAPAAACEVCFGAARNSNSPLVTGARLGVFLLLGVTVLVLGGFVSFFLYLRHRARQAEIDNLDSEWAQLQRSASS